MHFRKVSFAVVLAFVLSGCASTADTNEPTSVQVVQTVMGTAEVQSADTAGAPDQDAEDPDEVICKKIAKVGTRVKSKVCGTRAEWEASEDYAQKATEDMQRRPQQGREEG